MLLKYNLTLIMWTLRIGLQSLETHLACRYAAQRLQDFLQVYLQQHLLQIRGDCRDGESPEGLDDVELLDA